MFTFKYKSTSLTRLSEESSEPTLDEFKTVLDKIIKKSISLLERRGFLVKDNEDPLSFTIDSVDTFSQIQASSAIYRFATGPNRGKKPWF